MNNRGIKMSELIQTINTDEDRNTAKEQLEFLTSLLKEDSGGGDIASLKQEYSELMQKAKNIQEQIKNFNKENYKVYFRILDNYDHWYNDMAASTLNGTIGIMYDKKKQKIVNRNWGYVDRGWDYNIFGEILQINYNKYYYAILTSQKSFTTTTASPYHGDLFMSYVNNNDKTKTTTTVSYNYYYEYRPIMNYKE